MSAIDSLIEPNALAAMSNEVVAAADDASPGAVKRDARSPREIIEAAESFLAQIAGRRSVRQFAPCAPPRELVLRAIESATHAPSGMNKQPWRFVVVANQGVKAEMVRCVSSEIETILALLAGDEYADKVGAYLRNYATLFRNAPIVVNVLYREYGQVIASLLERSNIEYRQNQEEAANPAMQSVSAAIQNLQLAAHALGLATCWMTAPLFAKQQLHELLEVEDPWQLAAVVPIGYPALEHTCAPRRIRFDRVVRWID
jgi:nitroreductase